LLVIKWTQEKGKRKEIKEVFRTLKARIVAAADEIKKDFKL
jgi:hypothetical protein